MAFSAHGMGPACIYLLVGPKKYSPTGIRTRADAVKARYPDQLDYRRPKPRDAFLFQIQRSYKREAHTLSLRQAPATTVPIFRHGAPWLCRREVFPLAPHGPSQPDRNQTRIRKEGAVDRKRPRLQRNHVHTCVGIMVM